MLRQSAYL
jgi:hypothetical protein